MGLTSDYGDFLIQPLSRLESSEKVFILKSINNPKRAHFFAHQFVRLYKKLENRRGDVLKWGDEVEYNLVKVDKENSRAQLLLNAKPMLDFLHQQVWSILFC